MAVITGSDYLDIATSYANAREQVLGAKDFFFDAVYIIVQLNVIQPEVDLLIDFWQTYLINVDVLERVTLFLAAVRSLQNHVLFEGGFDSVDGYLESEGIKVPAAFAELSEQAGFAIDPANIA